MIPIFCLNIKKQQKKHILINALNAYNLGKSKESISPSSKTGQNKVFTVKQLQAWLCLSTDWL